MTNGKIPDQPTPKTGDDKNNLGAWLLIISGLAIFIGLAFRKKKKNTLEKIELDNAAQCPYFIEVDHEN